MSVISRKNQITLPVQVMREAGLEPGDEMHAIVVGPGRIRFVRTAELVDEFSGDFGADAYPPGYLEELRNEWE